MNKQRKGAVREQPLAQKTNPQPPTTTGTHRHMPKPPMPTTTSHIEVLPFYWGQPKPKEHAQQLAARHRVAVPVAKEHRAARNREDLKPLHRSGATQSSERTADSEVDIAAHDIVA